MRQCVLVYPGGSDSIEYTRNAGDLGLIPGLGGSPGEGHGNPLQYSCLENSHGQRSLVHAHTLSRFSLVDSLRPYGL